MSGYEPPRGEVLFRLWLGVFIIGLGVIVAIWRGGNGGPAVLETIGVAVVFGGALVIWALRKLRRGR